MDRPPEAPSLDALKAGRLAPLHAAIRAAEAAQARPVRELMHAQAAGAEPPAAALERLAAIDADIAALRERIAAVNAAADAEALAALP